MDGLQIILIALVSVWTIIFIIIAVAIFMIFLSIRRGLNKINHIIDLTEDVAEQVNLPSKAVIATILAFMAKNSVEGITKLVKDNFGNSKKKNNA